MITGAIISALSIIADRVAGHFLTRDARKRDIRTERGLDATEEAYWRCKIVQSMASSATAGELDEHMVSQEEWFFRHCMHFPDAFGNKWMTLRNRTLLLNQRDRRVDKSNACIEEMNALEREIEDLASECLKILNDAMGKRELSVTPWKPPTPNSDDDGTEP